LTKDPNKFLFSLRSSYFKEKDLRSHKFICMQFNPTHPMAIPFIIEVHRTGSVIRGTYQWGRRVRPYYYDLDSDLYRVHSDVWLSRYGSRYSYMSCFDMISNYNFYEGDMAIMLDLSKAKPVSYNSLFMIESYEAGDREGVYSAMTGSRGGNKTYTPAFSYGFDGSETRQKYVDVTDKYYAFVESGQVKSVSIVKKKNSSVVYTIRHKDLDYKRRENFVDDDRIFFNYSSSKGLIEVLRKWRESDGERRTLYRMYVPGGFFFRCPRNKTGSLLMYSGSLTIEQAVELYRENSDVLKPYAYRMPVYGATVEEVIVASGDEGEYSDYNSE